MQLQQNGWRTRDLCSTLSGKILILNRLWKVKMYIIISRATMKKPFREIQSKTAEMIWKGALQHLRAWKEAGQKKQGGNQEKTNEKKTDLRQVSIIIKCVLNILTKRHSLNELKNHPMTFHLPEIYIKCKDTFTFKDRLK